jgi:hypothetical protein
MEAKEIFEKKRSVAATFGHFYWLKIDAHAWTIVG